MSAPARRRAVAAALSLALAATTAWAGPEKDVSSIPPWGVALDDMDPAVDPGDDFNRYVSGAWLDRTEIAPGDIRAGSRESVRALVEARIGDIIRSAAENDRPRDPVEAQIGDLYASYMDTARRDALGLTPIRPLIEALEGVTSPADVAFALGAATGRGQTSPLQTDVSFDYQNTERLIARVAVEGLGLPNPDYYTRDEPRYAEARQAYLAYVERLLDGAGRASAAQDAEAILAFETRIAAHHWPGAARRDLTRITTIYRREDLAAAFPGFDWDAYLEGAGYGLLQEIVIQHPSATGPVIAEIGRTPMEVLRAYLTFHLIAANADYLDAAHAEAKFAFTRAVSGQVERAPLEQQAQRLVENAMSEAVGRAYVDRHFSAEARDAAIGIADLILAELRERIRGADWMSPDTRREALTKLDRVSLKIGYPDQWTDFSALEIDRGDLAGNVARIRAWRITQDAERLRRPADRWRWFLPAHSTNAGYNPAFNEIILPAGILQPPFFDPAADPAVNFGAVGGVIGHELSHGFDDIGRRLDAEGELRDWWTLEDAARFEAQANRLVEQYSRYEYAPGHHVDGAMTLGENLADVNGLSLAFGAYQRSLEGQTAPVLDGFTGAQRVFIGWAQMRRAKEREASLIARMPGSPHSPDAYRVNGVVRNIDAWYEAFGVTPSDRLHLVPEDRVSTW